jgi:hypothetical protein
MTATPAMLTDEQMAEYVREHRCYNARPGVSIGDWDRGVKQIEREASASATTLTEVDRSMLARIAAEMRDSHFADWPDQIDEMLARLAAQPAAGSAEPEGWSHKAAGTHEVREGTGWGDVREERRRQRDG